VSKYGVSGGGDDDDYLAKLRKKQKAGTLSPIEKQLLDTRDKKKWDGTKRSGVGTSASQLLKVLDKPGQAVRSGLADRSATSAVKGLIGKKHTTATEMLSGLVTGDRKKIKKLPFGVDTALSIASDPTTYLSFGASKAAKQGLKVTASTLGKEAAETVAKRGGKALTDAQRSALRDAVVNTASTAGARNPSKTAEKMLKALDKSGKGGLKIGGRSVIGGRTAVGEAVSELSPKKLVGGILGASRKGRAIKGLFVRDVNLKHALGDDVAEQVRDLITDTSTRVEAKQASTNAAAANVAKAADLDPERLSRILKATDVASENEPLNVLKATAKGRTKDARRAGKAADRALEKAERVRLKSEDRVTSAVERETVKTAARQADAAHVKGQAAKGVEETQLRQALAAIHYAANPLHAGNREALDAAAKSGRAAEKAASAAERAKAAADEGTRKRVAKDKINLSAHTAEAEGTLNALAESVGRAQMRHALTVQRVRANPASKTLKASLKRSSREVQQANRRYEETARRLGDKAESMGLRAEEKAAVARAKDAAKVQKATLMDRLNAMNAKLDDKAAAPARAAATGRRVLEESGKDASKASRSFTLTSDRLRRQLSEADEATQARIEKIMSASTKKKDRAAKVANRVSVFNKYAQQAAEKAQAAVKENANTPQAVAALRAEGDDKLADVVEFIDNLRRRTTDEQAQVGLLSAKSVEKTGEYIPRYPTKEGLEWVKNNNEAASTALGFSKTKTAKELESILNEGGRLKRRAFRPDLNIEQVNALVKAEGGPEALFDANPLTATVRRAHTADAAVEHAKLLDKVASLKGKDGNPFLHEVTADGKVPSHFEELDLTGTVGKKYAGHPEVVKTLNEAAAFTINDESMALWEQNARAVMNTWRGLATLGPAFHARNSIGNVWLNTLAGVVNPKHYAEAMKMQSRIAKLYKNAGPNKTVDDLIGDLPERDAKIIRGAVDRGVVGRGFFDIDLPAESGAAAALRGEKPSLARRILTPSTSGRTARSATTWRTTPAWRTTSPSWTNSGMPAPLRSPSRSTCSTTRT
jgi:hypothetical protein